MKKVTGIGGVFFKCKNPKKVNQWYKKHLGLNTDEYGTTFKWRLAKDGTKKVLRSRAHLMNQQTIFNHHKKNL